MTIPSNNHIGLRNQRTSQDPIVRIVLKDSEVRLGLQHSRALADGLQSASDLLI